MAKRNALSTVKTKSKKKKIGTGSGRGFYGGGGQWDTTTPLYQETYLHSSIFTYRHFINKYKKMQVRKLETKALDIAIANSKKQFLNFATVRGGEKKVLESLREMNKDPEAVNKNLRRFYNKGNKKAQQIFDGAIDESVIKALEKIDFEQFSVDFAEASTPKDKKRVKTNFETRLKRIRKLMLESLEKSNNLTEYERKSINTFFMGKSSTSDFSNAYDFFLAIKNGEKYFEALSADKFIENLSPGARGQLIGDFNEILAETVINKTNKELKNHYEKEILPAMEKHIESIGSSITKKAKITGAEQIENKTIKVDILLEYMDLNGQKGFLGFSSKTIPEISKAKNPLFQFKIEETNDLDWIFGRMKKADSNISQDYIDFLTYLIINNDFINKKGMSSDKGKRSFNGTSISLFSDTREMVSEAFAHFAGVFIGVEMAETLLSSEEYKYSNAIIIDANRSIVIPVYRVLEKIKNEIAQNNNLVSASFESKSSGVTPAKFYDEKRKALKDSENNRANGYPRELLNVGSKGGESYKKSIKTKIYLKGLYSIINDLNSL